MIVKAVEELDLFTPGNQMTSFFLDDTTNMMYNGFGLTDESLKDLQAVLLTNPKAGDVIRGTGGLRKIRVSMGSSGKGKRGGARVLYVDIELKECIYFINVYSKDEKDDLTEDEKKAFKALVTILKEG